MIGESEWRELLAGISSGNFDIASVCEDGIPTAVQGGSYIDMREMIRALAAGYTRNFRRIKLLREFAKATKKGIVTMDGGYTS